MITNENKNVLDEIDRKLKEVFDYAAENGILITRTSVSAHTRTLADDIKIISYTVEYDK